MIYTLTPPDIITINLVVESRSQKASRKYSDKSESDVSFMGIAAEFAFAKMMNIPPDFLYTVGGDVGYDFRLLSGLTVEVKCRPPYRDFALVSPDLSGFRADIGVLMWEVSKGVYQFAGWTTRVAAAQLGKRIKLRDWRWVVNWRDMYESERLVTIETRYKRG